MIQITLGKSIPGGEIHRQRYELPPTQGARQKASAKQRDKDLTLGGTAGEMEGRGEGKDGESGRRNCKTVGTMCCVK